MRLTALFSAHAAVAASVGDALVTIPSRQPPFAKTLDPSLSAFSLEFQYWPSYAGNATGGGNAYINQLLRNLGERTGKTPAIRVGGKLDLEELQRPPFHAVLTCTTCFGMVFVLWLTTYLCLRNQ